MADRKPLKVLPDGGGDSTGLGEFVAADTIGVVDGGTGLYHTLRRGSALRRDARSMRRGDGAEAAMKAGRRARTILPVNCDPHRSLSLPIIKRSASSEALL